MAGGTRGSSRPRKRWVRIEGIRHGGEGEQPICHTEVFIDAAYKDVTIDQGSQASWMRRMRFLRDGVATSAACADAEEVRVGDKVVGKLLGKGWAGINLEDIAAPRSRE